MHGMVCGVPFGCRTILLLCNPLVVMGRALSDALIQDQSVDFEK
jgi:hypothetical protein